MFGPCKICIEKEKRIDELKLQIAYFKAIINPPPKISRYELESDQIMSGGGQDEVNMEQLKIQMEAESIETQRIQQEQDAIYSGNT